ncbi:MAG: winged helix-turn-helix domain-containing protein [Desulfosporosinus sp.]|nr:winged helix-turn-helix domain-containing protein [Desulfosporosinus sp.]
MATFLDIHKVTVSRIMKKLSQENVIKKMHNSIYILDYNKLL